MNLRPRKRSSPIIPIVALVDILVIVLLFVVATTTFKQSQTQMEITLPESSSLGSDSTPQQQRKTLAITKDKRVILDGSEITPENLSVALQEMKLATPNTQLELQADQDTPLGLLVKIWDALKSAGFPVKEVPARIQRSSAS